MHALARDRGKDAEDTNADDVMKASKKAQNAAFSSLKYTFNAHFLPLWEEYAKVMTWETKSEWLAAFCARDRAQQRDEAVWITECELAGLRLLNMEALAMISVQSCRSRPQLQNKSLRDAGILV